MSFIAGADEDAKPKVEGGGGYCKIVRWNETPFAAQAGKEVGPAFGDLGAKIDDRNPGDERADLRSTAGRSGGGICQARANKKLRVDDGREGGRFVTDGCKNT